ncbi:MAG: hypothetical protein ACRDXE_00600, partial [Acidimicrobiales bacterium]
MSERIIITPEGDHAYTVALHDGPTATRHQVVVPPALTADLGLGPDDEERLIIASFDFLLEREPSTSILARFDLDIIGRYFPQYQATMREQVIP